jgi:hypothetical protein
LAGSKGLTTESLSLSLYYYLNQELLAADAVSAKHLSLVLSTVTDKLDSETSSLIMFFI